MPSRRARPSTRKRTVKRRTKRAFKRKVFRPQNLVRVGFPKTTLVKLRYVETVTINPGIGSIVGIYNWCVNSLHNPNATSSFGHQPAGYDQWSTFYDNYIVLGSKLNAHFAKTSNSGQAGCVIAGAILSDGLTVPANYYDIMEQGLSKWTYGSRSPNRAQQVFNITKNFSAKKFFAVSDLNDNVDRLGAQVGTSGPQERAYVNLWLVNTDSSTDETAYQVTVTIEFLALFSKPKDLPQS